jgi:hypothetical protein
MFYKIIEIFNIEAYLLQLFAAFKFMHYASNSIIKATLFCSFDDRQKWSLIASRY